MKRPPRRLATSKLPDMPSLIGTHDIIFITLDTLRFDVAQQEWVAGRLPNLAQYLPSDGWQHCHSPASFTYAAHQAFFAGFLPTPASPGPHPRLFAARFAGSESIVAQTWVFEEANLPAALSARGYHSICIGGTGFFNPASALGQVLPGMFAESHWHPGLGVSHKLAPYKQVKLALQRLQAAAGRVFLFINISAIHRPNHFYLADCKQDNLASHAAALREVDSALAPLFAACAARAPSFCILCSDHGSAYGEAGYQGHRLAHASVWDVPYAHFFLPHPTESIAK